MIPNIRNLEHLITSSVSPSVCSSRSAISMNGVLNFPSCVCGPEEVLVVRSSLFGGSCSHLTEARCFMYVYNLFWVVSCPYCSVTCWCIVYTWPVFHVWFPPRLLFLRFIPFDFSLLFHNPWFQNSVSSVWNKFKQNEIINKQTVFPDSSFMIFSWARGQVMFL